MDNEYIHNKTRHNNPPAGLDNEPTKPILKTYPAAEIMGGGKSSWNLHKQPVLEWMDKDTKTDAEVLPLHIHESIHPSSIIQQILKGEQSQLEDFFGEQKSLSENLDSYTHDVDWTNRMILGDSLSVMTSLLEKEPKIAGRVQMVYFDPPYGINYDSNFQAAFNKKFKGKVAASRTNKKLKDIEIKPQPIVAFRDNWKYGIHSYLTMIRKRLLAAHEILADNGSIFVQISVTNVHRVRLLLDEVFGSENFVWEILFQTTSGAGAATHPSPYDYILWYSKDKQLLKKSGKLHQIYLERTDDENKKTHSRIHMKDNSVIIPKDDVIPQGGRRCRIEGLHSQNIDPYAEKRQPHTFPNGLTIPPLPTRQWSLWGDDLDKLYHKNRVYFGKNKKTASLIAYPEDYPKKMTNVWGGMGISGEKIYDVQTKTTVIERCITMCTDPGDLVLDITGGSGVTAYVSEQHGRRWISCDVSKLSIAISTCRLQNSVFPWYRLQNENIGISGGLNYESFVKLNAKAIADNSVELSYRYNKPIIEKKRARVCGPFTVEALPSPVVLSGDENLDDATRDTWTDALCGSGMHTINAGRTRFTKLTRNNETGSAVHYIGTDDKNRKAVISFGQPNSPMDKYQIERALKEIRPHAADYLLVVSSTFTTEAQNLMNDSRLDIIAVEAHADLLIPELKGKSSDIPFIEIGRPRFDIIKNNDGTIVVKLLGYNYFDPETNSTTFEDIDKVAMWMLDTDYDGRTMRVKQMFFPGKPEDIESLGKKLGNVLRSGEINLEALEKYKGHESLPFEPGNYKTIAIKTIDYDGREANTAKVLPNGRQCHYMQSLRETRQALEA